MSKLSNFLCLSGLPLCRLAEFTILPFVVLMFMEGSDLFPTLGQSFTSIIVWYIFKSSDKQPYLCILEETPMSCHLPLYMQLSFLNHATMDKLQLTGQNLGRVFNSRSSCMCYALVLHWIKMAKLKVENSAQTTLALALPDATYFQVSFWYTVIADHSGINFSWLLHLAEFTTLTLALMITQESDFFPAISQSFTSKLCQWFSSEHQIYCHSCSFWNNLYMAFAFTILSTGRIYHFVICGIDAHRAIRPFSSSHSIIH